MKPSDFINLDGFEKAIEVLKNGDGVGFNCHKCPFSDINATNGKACYKNGYRFTGLSCSDVIVMESAIEFEKMIKGDTMTKSDLVVGKHVVKTREGKYYLVLENELVGLNNYFGSCLKFHNEYLNYENCSHCDIVEIYVMKIGFILNNLKDETNLTSIWKRQEKSPTQLKLEELENEQRELADKIKQLRESL